MADFDWSYSLDKDPEPKQADEGVRWWDPLLNAAKGVTDMAGQAASSAQYATERAGSNSKLSEGLSEIFHGASDYLESNISEGGKRARDAAFVPHEDGQASIFENASGSLMMKASGFVAPLAALFAVPEAKFAQWAAGAALQDGQAIDAAISWTNQLSDQELAAKSPVFRQLVDELDDPRKARAQLHQMQITGGQLLVQSLIGAAGMGNVRSGLTGTATKGAVKGAALNGGEAFAGMGAAGAAGDYAEQEGKVAAGAQANHDIDRTVWAGLNAGLEMAVPGAVAGAYHGHMARDAKPPKNVPLTNEKGVDATTEAALGANDPAPAPKAADAANVGAPDAAAEKSAAVAPPEPEFVPGGSIPEGYRLRGGDGKLEKIDTPPAEQAPASPGDSALVAEPHEQIAAQLDQLVKGEGGRSAVMIPAGTKGPDGKPIKTPPGMERRPVGKQIFIYDPEKTNLPRIKKAMKDGTLNEILGLGDTSKVEATARVEQGEQPIAVQERDAEGTPVREAVGTEATAPAQVDHFEQTKAPTSTVETKSPEAVLQERATVPETAPSVAEPIAATQQVKPEVPIGAEPHELPKPKAPENDNAPRVLEDVSKEGKKKAAQAQAQTDAELAKARRTTYDATVREQKAQAELQKSLDDAEPKGFEKEGLEDAKHLKNEDKARVLEDNEKARGIVESGDHAPGEKENALWNSPAVVPQLKARLQRLLDEAKAQGIKLPQRVTKLVPDHTAFLVVARDTLRALNKATGKSALDIVHKFKAEEFQIIAGGDERTKFADMRARRRQEGEEAMRQGKHFDGEHYDGSFQPDEDGSRRTADGDKPTGLTGEGGGVHGVKEDEADTIGKGGFHDPMHEREREVSPDEVADEGIHANAEEAAAHLGAEREKAPEAKPEAVQFNEAEHVTKGTDKAGTFQVAKKRNIAIPGKKPNVAAVRQAHSLEDGLLSDGKLFTNTGERVQPVNTITVKGIAGHLPETRNILVDKMRRAVFAMLSKKLPDLKIHILRDEDMDRTQGAKTQGYHVIFANKDTGEYMHQTQHIALRMSHFTDGELNAKGMHTLMHEGVHALTSLEVDNNAGFRKAIERIRDEVKRADPSMNDYGLKDAHEFLAEALTNPVFQDALRQIKISKELAEQFGMQQHSKLTRMWDGLVELVRKSLGLHPSEFTALEAAMRATELGTAMQSVGKRLGTYKTAPKETLQSLRRPSTDEVKEKALDWKTNRAGALRRAGDKLSSFTMLTQRARKAFGAKLPDRLDKLFQAQRVKADKNMEVSNELYRRHAEAKRADAAEYGKMTDLAHDSQGVNYDPSQPHALSGDKTKDWQLKARQADLDARYASLSPELKKLYRETVEHFNDLHNQAALGYINNKIRETLGHDDPGLAQRIHDDAATTADRDLFKSSATLKNLNAAAEWKKTRGYFPQMRHGDFVVNGRHDLGAIPAGAIKIDNDTVRFHGASDTAVRRQAKAYAEAHNLDVVKVEHKTVDKNDPGGEKVEPQHMDAEHAYDVRLQTQHTEFHETESGARKRSEELAKQGVLDTSYTHIREASKVKGLLSHEMAKIAESVRDRDDYKGLTAAQKNAVHQSIVEATLRMRGGVNPSRMHRRNVKGADKDVPRAIAEYGSRMARHLAREELKPEVDATLKEMYDYAKENKNDGNRLRRDELLNELDKRINAPEVSNSNSIGAKIANRLLQTTFLGKLGSPAFHFINAMEPHTTTLPILIGRHSIFGAERALLKAYDMIGGLSTIKSGFKDTKKAFNHDDGFTDYLADMKTRVKTYPDGKRLAEVLDYLHDHGLFDRDAGMDIERHANPSSNAAGRAIDRMDLMARQLGTAVEANNRAVSGLAAYMLESKRNGGDHEAALKYAYDVVHDGMGNYAGHNAAPIFNHPIGRLALQFKKFGHKTYYLWGKAAKGMIAGDKEQARIFASLVGTHMLMAGALGLPLEPIKIALVASNALGVLDYSYNDFEDDMRKIGAKVLGAKGGEIFMRGLPRLANVELSSRMGVDGLATFGQPKSGKADDSRAWLFQNLTGAAINTLIDGMAGVRDMINASSGADVAKAAAQVVPLKVASDSLKAYSGYTRGKQSKTGRETMEPLSAGEAALQAFGLKSAREAENGARRGAAGGDQQQFKQQRDKLTQAWVLGKGADRAKAMIAINKWNAGQPKDAQITLKDLKASEKRRANESDSYIGGIRVNKRDRHIVEEKSYYNYK